MIASLPMYDRPETAGANDRLWQLTVEALADREIHVKGELDRDSDVWDTWLNRDLVLSQTCGLPYRWKLHDKVNLVATPIHHIRARPGHYYSVLAVRSDDTRKLDDLNGCTIAVNDGRSQSGWAAPLAFAQRHAWTFGRVKMSGAHVNSAKMVACGDADIAAIDVVTWHLIQRYDSFAKDLKLFATTPQTPALPYICALNADREAIASALSDAIATLSPADRNTLCLRGVTQIAAEDYLAVTTPEPPGPDVLE